MISGDNAGKVVAVGFTLGGNAMAWIQSVDLGVVAGAVTALGLAGAGVYSAWTDRRIKAYSAAEAAKVEAYKATERARMEMELERDRLLGPTITRKLEAALRDLDEAKQDRDNLRDQLDQIQVGVKRIGRKVAVKPRVLIVDDDPDTCDIFCKILSRKGYDCEQAHTLDEARKQVSPRFTWVILDVVLPGGSGLDLLREIRDKKWLVRVAVMTGFGDGALAMADREMADIATPKPVNVGQLIADMRALEDKTPRPHASDLDIATIPQSSDGEGGP